MQKHIMKHIVEIAKENGYIRVDNASMTTSAKYIKEGNCIMWGLNELHKPPTLMYPRPNIYTKVKNGQFGIKILRENWDDAMNICLQRENHQDIFDALFDRTITFEYNLL